MSVKFSAEQIRELEDKVINFISPMHMILQQVDIKGLTKKDVNLMLSDLNRLIKYIRELRPAEQRYVGK
jgi:hypothetical protein